MIIFDQHYTFVLGQTSEAVEGIIADEMIAIEVYLDHLLWLINAIELICRTSRHLVIAASRQHRFSQGLPLLGIAEGLRYFLVWLRRGSLVHFFQL